MAKIHPSMGRPKPLPVEDSQEAGEGRISEKSEGGKSYSGRGVHENRTHYVDGKHKGEHIAKHLKPQRPGPESFSTPGGYFFNPQRTKGGFEFEISKSHEELAVMEPQVSVSGNLVTDAEGKVHDLVTDGPYKLDDGTEISFDPGNHPMTLSSPPQATGGTFTIKMKEGEPKVWQWGGRRPEVEPAS